MLLIFVILIIFTSCGYNDEIVQPCKAKVSRLCEISGEFPEDLDKVSVRYDFEVNELEDRIPSKCKPKIDELTKDSIVSYLCSHNLGERSFPGDYVPNNVEKDENGLLRCNLRGINNIFTTYNESSEQALLNIDDQKLEMECRDSMNVTTNGDSP